jgi:DMSO/TMAO reductase YedYZ heme-binding membrane subunit
VNVGSLTWDVARVGGLVAYALLTASVAIGLALSLGWRSPRWTRFVTNEVHRFVTLLALVFVIVHGAAVAIDPFIKMGVTAVLVPFIGTYRPIWVSMGIIAGYLAIAVYLSERVRGRIGYAWWRRFHAFAFLAFVLALVHGVASGSDTRTPWALGLYFGSLALVGFLLALRLFPEAPKRKRPLAAGLAIVLATGVIGFTFVGPLRPGWSARAGGASTTAVAASPAPAASARPTATPAPVGLGVPVSKSLPFSGSIGRRGAAVQVQGATEDGSAAFLFQLTSTGNGGTAGQVVMNTGTSQVCQGTVGSIGNTTIVATCSTGDGTTWSLQLAVTQASQNQISGTFRVAPASGGVQPVPRAVG